MLIQVEFIGALAYFFVYRFKKQLAYGIEQLDAGIYRLDEFDIQQASAFGRVGRQADDALTVGPGASDALERGANMSLWSVETPT